MVKKYLFILARSRVALLYILFFYWKKTHCKNFERYDHAKIYVYLLKVKILSLKYKVTRMTQFIKTKFKISDNQMNVDKYRIAANITEYHIISKLILQQIVITKFPSKRIRKIIQIGP